MDAREDRIPFEVFLRRSWLPLCIGGFFVIGICVLLFQFTVRGSFRMKGVETPVSVAADILDTAPRFLDGVQDGLSEQNRRVYAVMIDNAPDARPLSGPAKADLVIEAPVEGGITRFLLAFHASTTVDRIGPVRSAREYFVDWGEALDAVYAHVGGSPSALLQIKRTEGFRDLNEFSHPLRFIRDTRRSMPHNVYTSTDDLSLFAEVREWTTSLFEPWAYETGEARGDVKSVEIPYGGPWSVEWEYDAATDDYVRRQGGKVQKDEDGEAVHVRNVVVLKASARVVDDVGRLDLRTVGEGRAVVFRNGMRIDGTWERAKGEWIKFMDREGEAMTFEPGRTWISVVTSDAMFPL